MSAKETVEQPSAKVDEIAQQLKETQINEKGGDDGATNADKPKKKKNKKKKTKETEDSNNPDNINGETGESNQCNSMPDSTQTVEGSETQDGNGTSEEAKKKRKRNRNKNKKKADDSEDKTTNSPAVKQTDPPTLPVSQLFPDNNFPVGQIMDHHIAKDDRKAADRFSSEESRAIDRAQLDMYNEIRQAAEAHRQTRQYIQKWVKPGMKMIDICNELESTARKLINENGLKVSFTVLLSSILNAIFQ